MRGSKFGIVFAVSFCLFGLPASAICLSYYDNACPFDIGDEDSVTSYLANLHSSVFDDRFDSIDDEGEPAEEKKACILSCHQNFASSEQACLSIPDTPTQSGGLRTSCLNAAVDTFNECIRDECGIFY